MVARVARFAGQPNRFTTGEYKWVLETIRGCDGFVTAFHLVDEQAGESISFSVFENQEAATRAEQQVRIAREHLGRPASSPDEVHLWQIIDQA